MKEEQLLPPAASGQLLELPRLYRYPRPLPDSYSSYHAFTAGPRTCSAMPPRARQWLRTPVAGLNNVPPATFLYG